MRIWRTCSLVLLGTVAGVSACAERTTGPITGPAVDAIAAAPGGGIIYSTTGEGRSQVTSPPLAVGIAEWSLAAHQHADGRALGEFRMTRMRAGFVVDFSGIVTCVSVDPVNNRAWIGGVVTENRSNDPVHTGAIHQPGRDVWFRVVDNGEGAGAAPDRSSVLGFQGAAGIITSAEYCATKPWTAGDVNAFEVVDGNIQVRIR